MKLEDLKKKFRPVPEEPESRSCTICAWEGKVVPAKYVATGARVIDIDRDIFDMFPGKLENRHPQWFDCGGHPGEPNGAVQKLEDIGPWLKALQDNADLEARHET